MPRSRHQPRGPQVRDPRRGAPALVRAAVPARRVPRRGRRPGRRDGAPADRHPDRPRRRPDRARQRAADPRRRSVSAGSRGAPVSRTRPTGCRSSARFHGRDIFAPAAAHLARAPRSRSSGRPSTPPASPRRRCPTPSSTRRPAPRSIYVDTFGNVKLRRSRRPRAALGDPAGPGTLDARSGDGRAAMCLGRDLRRRRPRRAAAVRGLVRTGLPRPEPGSCSRRPRPRDGTQLEMRRG